MYETLYETGIFVTERHDPPKFTRKAPGLDTEIYDRRGGNSLERERFAEMLLYLILRGQKQLVGYRNTIDTNKGSRENLRCTKFAIACVESIAFKLSLLMGRPRNLQDGLAVQV
jgi:hypothetical protein